MNQVTIRRWTRAVLDVNTKKSSIFWIAICTARSHLFRYSGYCLDVSLFRRTKDINMLWKRLEVMIPTPLSLYSSAGLLIIMIYIGHWFLRPSQSKAKAQAKAQAKARPRQSQGKAKAQAQRQSQGRSQGRSPKAKARPKPRPKPRQGQGKSKGKAKARQRPKPKGKAKGKAKARQPTQPKPAPSRR